mmetsp:Transcript_800/g.2566  ORF Transcript_800/g.2566 Transcript_800/m.2566 type:complete len:274 (+) Transcript_800:313-1134(+)
MSARYLPCCAATCAVGGNACRFLSMRSSRSLNSSRSSRLFLLASISAMSAATASKPLIAVLSPAVCCVRESALRNASCSRRRFVSSVLKRGPSLGSSSESFCVTVSRYSAYSSSWGNSSEAPRKSSRRLDMVISPSPLMSAALKSCSEYGATLSWYTVAASPRAKTEPPLPRTWSHSSVLMPRVGAFRYLMATSFPACSFASMSEAVMLSVRSCFLMPAAQTTIPCFRLDGSWVAMLVILISVGVTSTTLMADRTSTPFDLNTSTHACEMLLS